MNKKEKLLDALLGSYPALVVDTCLFNGEGQFNDVLIINNEIIFRFPRYESELERLGVEINFLKAVGPRLSMAIPNPCYACLEPLEAGKAFMGYPMIPGEPLWLEQFQSIEEPQTLQHLAKQIAGFLKELHALPTALLGSDLPNLDRPAVWEEMYAEIRHNLYSFMRSEKRVEVQAHFETYLNSPHWRNYQPTLRHGDFGTGNLLYHDLEQRISGVIDFGFAGMGDPALDLAAVSNFGEAFFANILAEYPIQEGMLARAGFYTGTFALQEALHGWRNHDR